MSNEVTIITRSGERRTFKTDPNRREVVSSRGVQPKTRRIERKGQKDPSVVPAKLVKEPLEEVRAEVRIQRVGKPPTRKTTTLQRKSSFDLKTPSTELSSREIALARGRQQRYDYYYTQQSLEGYTPATSEELMFGKESRRTTDFTRPVSPGQRATQYRRIAYRAELIPESQKADLPGLKFLGGQLTSVGTSALATGAETVSGVQTFARNPLILGSAITGFYESGRQVVTNPAKAIKDFNVKVQTPSGFGDVVADYFLIDKGISIGRKVVGRGVDEARFFASTYRVPIEALAEPNVVSGVSRLNIGSTKTSSLSVKFSETSPIPGIVTEGGRTGLFFTQYRMADFEVLRTNRDLLGNSVAPPTAGSPYFALGKGKGERSVISALFSGDDVQVPLLPKRKQPTGALLETVEGFKPIPQGTKLEMRAYLESQAGRSAIFEAPKYKGTIRGEQEGNIPVIPSNPEDFLSKNPLDVKTIGPFVDFVEEGIFKPNTLQRLIGGGSAYTRFQGQPIRLRKGVVLPQAIGEQRLKKLKVSKPEQIYDYLSSGSSGVRGSLAGFIGKQGVVSSLVSRSVSSRSPLFSSGSRSRSRSRSGLSSLLSSSRLGRSSSTGSLLSSRSGSSRSPLSSLFSGSSSFGRSTFSTGLGSSRGSSFGRSTSISRGGSSIGRPTTTTTTNLFSNIPEAKFKGFEGRRSVSKQFLPTSNLLGLTIGKGIKVKTGRELLPGLGLARLRT